MKGGGGEPRQASLRAMVSIGHWFASRLQGGWIGNINGGITSHVLFTLKHYEGVATVWLLFLVALLIGVCIPNDPNLAVHVSGDTMDK